MTPNRLLNLALTLAITLGIAAVAATAPHLDGPDAPRAGQPAPSALADAQRAAQQAAALERAAQRQCTRLHGPGSGHRYTPDGALVCTDPRGRAATTYAAAAPEGL